jgi:hypothetical protein
MESLSVDDVHATLTRAQCRADSAEEILMSYETRLESMIARWVGLVEDSRHKKERLEEALRERHVDDDIIRSVHLYCPEISNSVPWSDDFFEIMARALSLCNHELLAKGRVAQELETCLQPILYVRASRLELQERERSHVTSFTSSSVLFVSSGDAPQDVEPHVFQI